MRYLGGLRGTGTLTCGDETIARADYELDGFLTKLGEVAGCGEIRMSPEALRAAFARKDVRLLTDDGRLLRLEFSGMSPSSACDAAHVDVAGELPASSEWRR